MPTMETGRGAEPGLSAAWLAALELVTWWNTEESPAGEKVWADARHLAGR